MHYRKIIKYTMIFDVLFVSLLLNGVQDQSKCTETGHRALENVYKQLLFKDLKNIWEKTEPDLPFKKGEYSPTNTLLIDDSPYKALCNPVSSFLLAFF
jgi:hypothetical protein